ncbi:adenylate/guanylate cyclase domain-containing protein [Reyranella sp. CPCC 100927]|uniref:adenylate/guanylate cyclase domain-containing protein n=1 Tax=Reyranella sp. CPCC 100927 TaxID=2599616 RepID=UPI0011B85C7E|nr:adenylate/guanylate cyclase domain-containing protein [Reyranella sp. CPCC 100927]TWT02027.1 adenylate/guanylate cyclase domain-containing protein [Reyranella sp. CPCC 100927]
MDVALSHGTRIDPVIDWIVREGRLEPELPTFVGRLMERTVASGIPVWRLYLGMELLHPQLQAMGVVWRRDQAIQVTEIPRRQGIQYTSAYIGSPVQEIRECGCAIRYRLQNLTDQHHMVLHEVKADGGTDYFGQAIPTSRGRLFPIITFSTDYPDGFSDTDLADLRRLIDHIGAVVEMHITRLVARTVIQTYIGPETGRRIFDGLVKRGDGDRINAVLWFSDLRDFTGLNERLPGNELLDMLNMYFEAIGVALKKHGGEILKFIGDGVMAIFPVDDAMFLPDATSGAVDAAREALSAIEEVNAGRVEAGRDAIRFGVGLHVGLVTFGNVGTEDRLDFTVIGPAVNRCARLETMTKVLKVPILASADFNRVCPRPMRSLGRHRLRGVPDPVEMFTTT